MKTDAERGPIGTWAFRERKKRKWKDEQAVHELMLRTGVELKATTLRGIEAGPKPPSEDVIRALEKLYGTKAPEPRAAVGLADLVAALYAQTDAIKLLVDRLGVPAEVGAGMAVGVERAAHQLAALPPPEEPPAPSRRQQPRGVPRGSVRERQGR
jgi:hypothetical protein